MIHQLQLIGESSNNISDKIKQEFPEVKWREIIGLRNFVVHEYFGVDLNEIWNTISKDLPLLKKQIQEISESINK